MGLEGEERRSTERQRSGEKENSVRTIRMERVEGQSWLSHGVLDNRQSEDRRPRLGQRAIDWNGQQREFDLRMIESMA